jgi:DNA invertase Pin-like site-specific DNA recombinase
VPKPSPLAFSYIRFSLPSQAQGDSLRRQTAATEAWCARNGVRLDTSTTLRDLGRSAFAKHKRKGDDGEAASFLGMSELVNPDRHALTAFCRLVQDGKVPRGSFFVIENLDRLSRDNTVSATHLLTSILMSGVRVVQLSPAELVLTDKADPFDVMRAVLELSRGHSESAMKSDRVGKAWRQKRANAGKTVLTARGPAWLRLAGGKWQVVKEAAATVNRIFELAVAGHGLTSIIKRLNAEGVPTISTAKSRAQYWAKGSVAKVLRNDAVRGIYQPFTGRGGKRRPDGEPVAGYYPRIIDEQTWFAARAALAGRKEKRGSVGKGPVNLFAHLLHDARNGGTMIVEDKGEGKGGRRLVSYRATQGVGSGASFPLPSFEEAVLRLLREIDPREILPKKDRRGDKVEELKGRRQDAKNRIDKLKLKLLNGGDSDALADVVRTLESQEKALAEELAEAQQEAATPASEAWDNAKTLIDVLKDADDPEDVRLRLRAAIRRVVESVWVLVVPRGRDRLCACQMRFAGSNRRRDYLIVHRRGHGGPIGPAREPEAWACSLADVVRVGDLDLRQTEGAAALERRLLGLDLSSITGGCDD